MHELSLIRNVVDIALGKCKDLGAARITKVQVVVGEGRDVVDEFAIDLYERLTHGTPAEGSQLELLRTPITARCKPCGFVFPINVNHEETWVCPSCGAERNFRLCTGMEFMVRSIEVTECAQSEVATGAQAPSPAMQSAS